MDLIDLLAYIVHMCMCVVVEFIATLALTDEAR